MPAITPSKLHIMSLAKDPKEAIWSAIGRKNLDSIEVLGARLLLATYIPPEKIGSIIMPDRTKDEALWQGSISLVLKLGKQCFLDDDQHKFHGERVEVGQWVIHRYSSGFEQHFNGVAIRFLPDTEVMGTIVNPAMITSRPVGVLGG